MLALFVSEAVLLGAAMLGATASGRYASVTAAMGAMSAAGEVVLPDPSLAGYFERKYRVFQQMHEDQLRYTSLME